MLMKLVIAALIALLVAAIIVSLPDIKRYREIREM
jgi:energy-converting hydrogenase Eha subunit A